MQYINRLPASKIVSILKDAGFEIVSVETHDCTMQRCEVHPDYHWQSDADIQAVRLFLRARKPDNHAAIWTSDDGQIEQNHQKGTDAHSDRNNDLAASVATKFQQPPTLQAQGQN